MTSVLGGRLIGRFVRQMTAVQPASRKLPSISKETSVASPPDPNLDREVGGQKRQREGAEVPGTVAVRLVDDECALRGSEIQRNVLRTAPCR